MKFSSIGHIAMRVADVDRSLAFYVGKLGLREMFRLHRDSGELWLLYLRVTDDQYIEIFPNATGEQAPDTQANGLNHLCLTVDNIEETIGDLNKAGIDLFMPLKVAADGNKQAWIKDPDGNRIELMQMEPDCKQALAVAALKRAKAVAEQSGS